MYTNPILPGVNPDPSICRVGQDYYLATSTFNLVPGVPIYHSRDLVNWRLVGHALSRREQFMLPQGEAQPNGGAQPEIYAPTLRHHQGMFYLVTTNVHGGGNFLVTATDPAGPWSGPIFIDNQSFDPSLFFDDDGKVYYTRRGSFERKDIVQAEIDVATGRLLTPLRSISLGLVSDDAEGPHLYKFNGLYYLMIAEGGSMYLHMETIGRSPSPWGPFEPCPWNPILAQHHAWWHPVRTTGHADLVQAHDGSWWMVFLATRHASYPALNVLGRESFLAPVTWKDGWPVVNPQAMRSLEVDVAALPAHPWDPPPARDDFDEPELRLGWVFTSFPDPGAADLSSRFGFLRLWGKSSLPGDSRPSSFVARRQTELASLARTQVDFEPQADSEEAGLAVLMARDYQYNLAVTLRKKQRVALLRKRVGDMVSEEVLARLDPGPVILQVKSEPEMYTFEVHNPAGDRLGQAGTALTRLLVTEMARTWCGLLVGMYASGNGRVCHSPADFDWFEYLPERLRIGPFY
jgi:alpha-N-arabinofuranosidase